MDDATTPQVSGDAGGEGLPNPTFSDGATSSPSVDADAIVSKLTPVIEQLIERKVQSTKDKRLSKIEKALGGRLDLLAELEETGVEIPKEVRSEMRLRELEERLAGGSTQPAPPPDAGPSGTRQAVTEAIATLQQYGLDSNDPAFIETLRGTYKNRAEFDAAVYKHVVSKLAPQKPASPAAVVQAPATGGATGKDPQALISDYKKEMLAAPRGPRGDEQRRAIKNKFIQMGADIHGVDFTA